MKIKKVNEINETENFKYTKKEIFELIENAEWEIENFERPTAKNSLKMIEIIKQLIKEKE